MTRCDLPMQHDLSQSFTHELVPCIYSALRRNMQNACSSVGVQDVLGSGLTFEEEHAAGREASIASDVTHDADATGGAVNSAVI
jgi:hypothetical protein